MFRVGTARLRRLYVAVCIHHETRLVRIAGVSAGRVIHPESIPNCAHRRAHDGPPAAARPTAVAALGAARRDSYRGDREEDTTMPELLIDLITSLDGHAAAKGWPGWWGLEGPEYLAWLGAQPEADYTS